MHGLINRSIQCFVRDTYGVQQWLHVARAIGMASEGFESMLTYDDVLTEELLSQTSRVLNKPEEMLLEDVGTYLISHPNSQVVRRLLRFGGESFSDFLHSLDDLPDRAKLAVSDLELPELELIDGADGTFTLLVQGDHHSGFAFVLIGILRALADDYGALVLLDQIETPDGNIAIEISLLDIDFSEGRSFSLAQPAREGGR